MHVPAPRGLWDMWQPRQLIASYCSHYCRYMIMSCNWSLDGRSILSTANSGCKSLDKCLKLCGFFLTSERYWTGTSWHLTEVILPEFWLYDLHFKVSLGLHRLWLLLAWQQKVMVSAPQTIDLEARVYHPMQGSPLEVEVCGVACSLGCTHF